MTNEEKENLIKLIRDYGKSYYLMGMYEKGVIHDQQESKSEIIFDQIKELIGYKNPDLLENK